MSRHENQQGMTFSRGVEAIKRYFQNRVTGKPLFVSVETLWRCNAGCQFCTYRSDNQHNLKTTERKTYADIVAKLNPVYVVFFLAEAKQKPFQLTIQ
ncbi:MAG: hypothetical protein EPN86_01005 [Nanoarchaeota archaeon]|nr:MAG: hypothetical protein EPN86_01005 [Nanoarchaeota archaeon]